MKRLVITFVVLLMLSVSCLSASAQQSFYISTRDDIKNNRLFEIDVYASDIKDLCAGEIEFSYDSNIAEYRKVQSDIFDIQAKSEDGRIKVVFATDETVTFSGDTKLFDITFKSISTGSFDFEMLCCECLGSELENYSPQIVESTVTVSENSVKVTAKDKTKSTTDESNRLAATVKTPQDESVHSFLTVVTDAKNKPVFYMVLIIVAVVILFVLGAIFGKNIMPENTKESKSDSQNKVD